MCSLVTVGVEFHAQVPAKDTSGEEAGGIFGANRGFGERKVQNVRVSRDNLHGGYRLSEPVGKYPP